MKHELTYLFDKLVDELEYLSPKAQDRLVGALRQLIDSLSETDLSMEQKLQFANQLATYLQKKSAELAKTSFYQEEFDLLKVGRSLRHGKHLPPEALQTIYPVFWKTLTRTARHWPPDELSNILAYCLRISPIFVDTNKVRQTKIVSSYKSICDSLPDHEKNDLFAEIIMRISGEPSFEKHLLLELKNRESAIPQQENKRRVP
jgi:hypothetical protein